MYTVRDYRNYYLTVNEEGYKWKVSPKYPNSHFTLEQANEWMNFFGSKGKSTFSDSAQNVNGDDHE